MNQRYDQAQIRELRNQGLTCALIAEQIGCSLSTVYIAINPESREYDRVRHLNQYRNKPRNPEREKVLYWRRLGMEPPKCIKCGGSIARNNKYGVCRRNPECLRENARLKTKANPRYSSYKYKDGNPGEITYLMFSAGLNTHKIGLTINLAKRLETLHTGCWDIELVTTFPYGRKLERWLHKRFNANRITGTEWFRDITEVDVKNAVAEFELGIK